MNWRDKSSHAPSLQHAGRQHKKMMKLIYTEEYV